MGSVAERMARPTDLDSLHQLNESLTLCQRTAACNISELQYHNYDSLDVIGVPGDGSPALLTAISLVYCLVSAVGLMGNLLVLYLLRSSKSTEKSTINVFVFNLAFADLQFSLILPFWAAEVALDFSWPFGHFMCKLVSLVNMVNVYASVFFLTAMSVTRYCTVATALQPLRPRVQTACAAKLVTGLIWGASWLAALPVFVFSSLATVGGEPACLLRFPGGASWLAAYHLLRIALGFLLPYGIILVSYLLLLRFLANHSSSLNPQRQTRVTKSVAVVVLAFFFSWLPNQVMTFWGVLVKLDVLQFDGAFYFAHTFCFPVSLCLAHANSCLNPVIYCLMRQEFRKALKNLLWRLSTASVFKSCLSTVGLEHSDGQVTIPLNNVDSQSVPALLSYTKRSNVPSLTATSNQRHSSPLINGTP
ncbi:relaxin-3 receptor 1-like [Lepisosteus oculatus]|uniref:Relaxin family peptide/INSL5 receptor 4 n=1 Tax=Lepisosteus oculatus TaxID=7918 RepID=W5NMC8_LEPOC|nr:PREDICTED: relaxin-3 receptor 1-like [Lepisosteus oculatus]XP_015192140.1 PREDICTED: relaxin-3 receptor 1-like [Lepisosteus oculatus]